MVNILKFHTKVSDKMAFTNSADPDKEKIQYILEPVSVAHFDAHPTGDQEVSCS